MTTMMTMDGKDDHDDSDDNDDNNYNVDNDDDDKFDDSPGVFLQGRVSKTAKEEVSQTLLDNCCS